ncbi:MAG: hypothetical protein ACK4MF_05645 [Hyphomicrobiaceae bacterium]
MTYAASASAPAISLAAALVFGVVVVTVAVYINRPAAWSAERLADPHGLMHAARRNARLMALVYAWGGFALLVVYGVSGLRWQHGWQYGSGMALIAAGLLIHVHKLGDEHAWTRSAAGLQASVYLALAQAIAAALVLVYLLMSGKLAAGGRDWAANHVFLAGGFAIVVISLVAAQTHTVLKGRRQGTHGISGS